jgi:hypothetical protein
MIRRLLYEMDDNSDSFPRMFFLLYQNAWQESLAEAAAAVKFYTEKS